MTSRTRTLLLAFAALGLGASAWSSYVHYALLTQAGYTTFCDVNSTISCTQAYLSEYGSIRGIPVAIAGVVFFVVVLLLAGLGGRRTVTGRDNVPAYIFALSTIGLAVVLYLAWASFFRLNAVCLLCLVTYVAVIGLFIVSGAASSPLSMLPRTAARDGAALLKSPVALVAAVLVTVGAVSLISVFPTKEPALSQSGPSYPPLTDQQRFDFLKWFDVQPRVDVPVEAGGARVVVVKFNDYQCPACRQAYVNYAPLEAKYEASGEVRFVLKHYPLEGECNPHVPGGEHRAACEAAAAVMMAQEPGTAGKLQDWLFANLPTLTPQTVREAAARVGGIQDFDSRYAATLAQVRADAELGEKLGVNSTPTFFINGVRIAGVLPPAAFDAALEHELKRSR